MKVKPWQMLVIVAGILVGGASIVWAAMWRDSAPAIPHIVYYIDVETGDIFRVDTKKQSAGGIPGRNPNSGRVTLLRVLQNGDKWSVDAHDRAVIPFLDKEAQMKAIDPKTGELLVPAKSPVDYQRKF